MPAHSHELDVLALVAACAGHRNGLRLIADNNVLCFDGQITHQTSLDPFRQLNSGGTLVVRSPGGLNVLAMHMADILLERNARVVIHGHCLSACANALFVATHETHVAEGAIVAWHGNGGCAPLPETLKETASEREKQTLARYAELCREPKIAYDFYRKRGISDDFTRRPQTPYSRKMFHAMHREAFDKRRIFWTWHADDFGSTFKSEIVFRSYPDEDTAKARMWRHWGCGGCTTRPASRRRSGRIAGTAGPRLVNSA